MNSPNSLQAVILDMDGTITAPVIDWHNLRSTIGVPPNETIMNHIRSLSIGKRQEATRILLETEMRGTEGVALNAGFEELVTKIREYELMTAVVTNNHGAAMQRVIEQNGLTFDVALSRDDGELKPAPDLINLALKRLGCSPQNAIGVGDSRLDTEACRAAGVQCIYLTHGTPSFDHKPSVESLLDVIPFLCS